MAPVIKRLSTLTFYWGVGGRMRSLGRALYGVLAELCTELLAELYAELLAKPLVKLCVKLRAELCRSFVESL